MASKAKVIQMVGAIKTLYSYYAKDVDNQQLVQLWTGLLKDYSDEEASFGLAEAMKVCTMPPTPADVISQIERQRDIMFRDSDVEIWRKLRDGLNECYRLTGYFGCKEEVAENKTLEKLAREKITAVWEGLPHEAKQFIGSEAEFIRKAKQDEKSLQIEEARFRKAFGDLRESAKRIEARIATEERKRING